MKKKSILMLCIVGVVSACTTQPTAEMSLVTQENLQGLWLVEIIDNQPVIDRSPATLIFNENGRLSGNSSCNGVMSSYQLTQVDNEKTSKLTFSQPAGTMMMCTQAQMDQEQRYLKALPRVTQTSIENGLLVLTDNEQRVLFRASKQ